MESKSIVPQWGEKRYNNINDDWRRRFGEKIGKVTLDAGFTCPNRDGTLSDQGCRFCSPAGSGDFVALPGATLAQQYERGREVISNKWPVRKYIAYLQSFTNTYAPAERLREIYQSVLSLPGVVGLAIATRPDCLPQAVLDLLAEINQQHYLLLELGLQTIHDRSAAAMNLQYNFADFCTALEQLQVRQIDVCAHIILGLPGEDRQDMMATAQALAELPLQGIKIQLLHLLRGTPLAEEYEEHPFPFLSQAEYVDLVTDIIGILPPSLVIHRLTGDGPRHLLLGPRWSLNKRAVLNAIDQTLVQKSSWQGKFYAKNSPSDS
ncbi:MAG TPA: TIGR01212 family radical SAM protein [Syntrophomonas sp.]|nr:TIGR01212 family radical SAM protein [Syntrophomonas sp.]HRW13022.1 TIGR01212 family radical SAM protein [Syntrophomonas sp.]